MKKITKKALTLLMAILVLPLAINAEPINQIRNLDIDQQTKAPPIATMVDDSVKQSRNYPMQPPLIPHNVQGYEVDLKVNKCMSCHARKRVQESQATMISVTHYMDREGNFLANISPRRYFCQQCHVPQSTEAPVIDNSFVDMDAIMQKQTKE